MLYVQNLSDLESEIWLDDIELEEIRDDRHAVIAANDYYPYGMTIAGRTFSGDPEKDKFKYQSKERDIESGYDYFEARYYDSSIGRFMQVDPLAHEFRGFSHYSGMGLNPQKYYDPDGKYFVGVNGERVDVERNEDGTLNVGENASAALRYLVKLANKSGSKTALDQIFRAAKNSSKIHIKVHFDLQNKRGDFGFMKLGVHQAHDKDGNELTWNSQKGDFEGTPAYSDENGDEYAESTIHIFVGNIKEGGYRGTQSLQYNVTPDQVIANTFQHETHHNTDKEFIKDLKNKREGKPNKNMDPHKNINPQERKVLEEMENANKGNKDN